MRGLILLLLLTATPALAAARISEPDARAFVARQEQAWNAGDLARYFAAFTPDARFTDQAYVGDKPPAPYGTSTLAQARAQARKSLVAGKPRETGQVVRVLIAPDGASARVEMGVVSVVKARRLCATRVQTVVLAGGQLRSRGQTDTYIRCRGG